MKNLKLFALLCAMTIFAVSCGEETVTNTEADGSGLNLPTISTPTGGWTAEEQAFIIEFGGITEVIPTQEFISGIKRTYHVTAETGDPEGQPKCTGSVQICTWTAGTWTEETIDGEDTKELDLKKVNDIPIIKITTTNSDSTAGSTKNGLLPVRDFLILSEADCAALNISSCVIYPGLYYVHPDSSNIIYVEGLIEE